MAAERGSISIDALSKSLDATTIEPSNDRTEQHGDVETKAKKLTVSSEFDGAVVFITGAASGIGQLSAQEFASQGCQKLFLVDISHAKLEKTKALIRDAGLHAQVELYEGDVSNETSVKGMVQKCVELYGRIDIACNIAGISGKGPWRTSDTPVENFDSVCSVNERGVILCEKYQLEQMVSQELGFAGQRGSIVNIASIAGKCIIPIASAYGASKHAVVAVTRCDALRHIQDAIRINSVSPGATWTPMLSDGGIPEEFVKLTALMAPMHRFMKTIEVVNAVLFLAGPKASAISGVDLPVDCGTQLLRSF